jgi:hypothetical protein
MFKAIWVRTGKSANATLIHCALHPVATNEMLNTNINAIFVIEFDFMSASPCVDRVFDLDLWSATDHVVTAASAVLPSEARQRRRPQKQNRHRPKPMAIFLEIFEAIST